MSHKLKDLEITEVSLVDRPANPGAKVMLFKRDEPKPNLKERFKAWLHKAMGNDEVKPKTFNSCMMAAKLDDFWWRTHDALRSSVRSIIESDATNKAELVKQSLTQYLETVMNALELTEPDPLMLHKGADKLREQMAELDNIALALDEDVAKAGKMISDANMKRLVAAMDAIKGILEASGAAGPDEGGVAGGKMTKGSGNKMDLKDILKALPEDQRKQVEAELAKADELKKQIEELQKAQPQPTPGPEDIWKGINPEIKKQFESLQKRAEDAEKLAKSEKEARENAEFEKRASAYSHIGSAQDIAKMLKQAYAISEDYGKQLEQTFKASQERIGKGGLFVELGKDGSVGSGTVAKIEAAASDIQKAQPSLTKEQAFAKALEAHPELYEEYRLGM